MWVGGGVKNCSNSTAWADLVSDEHGGDETMEIVKVTTEVDQAGAHHGLQVRGRRDDGGGGVVTKPDSTVRLMGRLRERINYNILHF